MKKLTNAQIREQVRKDLTKSFQKKYEIELKSLEEFKRLYHKTLAEKEELASFCLSSSALVTIDLNL